MYFKTLSATNVDPVPAVLVESTCSYVNQAVERGLCMKYMKKVMHIEHEICHLFFCEGGSVFSIRPVSLVMAGYSVEKKKNI